MDKLKSFTSSSLFLPIVALAVLLIFNGIFVEGFFDIQITEDGRLFGRVIDILTRSSSLVILSLGMTLVIATSGIDISVGAVVAISAAVVCTLIGGRGDGAAETPMALAMWGTETSSLPLKLPLICCPLSPFIKRTGGCTAMWLSAVWRNMRFCSFYPMHPK